MTPRLLMGCTGCMPQLAERWAQPLTDAMRACGITTPARIAAFLAQVAHESGRLRYTRELWGPTPAQSRYEGRADLGNTMSGDGFRFRGRGLIQITGRANYRAVGRALGVDLEVTPEILEEPDYAALASAHWWSANGLNELADGGDFDALSDRINRGRVTAAIGDANGYAERLALWQRATKMLALAEREEWREVFV